MDLINDTQNALLKAQLLKAQEDLRALRQYRDTETRIINSALQCNENENFELQYQVWRINKEKEILLESIKAAKELALQVKPIIHTLPTYIEVISNKTDDRIQRATEERFEKALAEKNMLIAQYEKKHLESDQKYRNQLLVQKAEISRLNSLVQDLKGNIRVYVRIRPKIGHEHPSDSPFQVDDDQKSLTLVGDKAFRFDHIFNESDNQETVYSEINGLIKSCVDGYNVCIFAYGATGSGKTHTMEGEQRKKNGLIHQAVRQIFGEQKQTLTSIVHVQAAFFEIYNEQIFDLLRVGPPRALDLRLNRTDVHRDDIYIPDLTEIQVASEADLAPLFVLAAKNRSVGETQSNVRSSRSHSVFRLKIESVDARTGRAYSSALHLIDLAGSERLQQSGAQGERLKETQNINKSLSHLGLVIQALHTREAHIPYRNSKLTHVLSSVLGGNAKVLMFVNIAPSDEQLPESVCSLRFAALVNSVSLGIAQRRVK